MLVHIFQLIPLSLFISTYSQGALFPIPAHFSHFYFFTFISVMTFLLSLKTDTTWIKKLYIGFITIFYLYLLNKLYLSPTLGIIISSVYLVSLFKLKNEHLIYKPVSSFSILWPYLISSVLYVTLKIKQYNDLDLTLLAVNLSFASLIYFTGIKSSLINTSRIIASVVIVISGTVLILLKELDTLLLFTDIWFVTVTILTFIILFKYKDQGLTNLTRNLFKFPEATVFSYFLVLAIIGTFLLELPLSRTSEAPLSLLDSFFTAISAVCVTGLIVLDTPVDLSLFGQSVILVLIQLGGFGIVAMSSWVLIGLKSSRLSLEYEEVLKEMSGHKPSLAGMQSTLRSLFFYFLTVELTGTLLLLIGFLQYDNNFKEALWRSLFTSISAFCNAGFALQSDSLIPYQSDSFILFVISLLIIAGGFAPLMALNLPLKIWKGKLNLQEKLVLNTTLSLLALGFIYFLIAEWNYSLGELSFYDKLVNSWFQSVTTRTAGFNSLDYSQFAAATPFFFMFLMFVGGNPGGTAGGIKTVTLAILFLAGIAGIRGETELRVFNRFISVKSVFRTAAIFLVVFLTTAFAFFVLNATQDIPIISLLFETVSAIGTVGLSIGATSGLDEIGKLLIILCMLLGRVGPLAFIMLLFRNQKKLNWKVPKEDVYIS